MSATVHVFNVHIVLGTIVSSTEELFRLHKLDRGILVAVVVRDVIPHMRDLGRVVRVAEVCRSSKLRETGQLNQLLMLWDQPVRDDVVEGVLNDRGYLSAFSRVANGVNLLSVHIRKYLLHDFEESELCH